MKRLLSVLMCISLILGSFSVAFANEEPANDWDAYLKIFEKLNQKFGMDLTIPEESADEVYEQIKNKSLAEFETDLSKSYETILDIKNGNYYVEYDTVSKSDFPIQPLATKSITQTARVYNSNGTQLAYLYLKSNVDGTLGEDSTWKYLTIKDAGSYDISGDHFYCNQGYDYQYTSSSKKAVDVTYYGCLKNGNIILPVDLTISDIRYNAFDF